MKMRLAAVLLAVLFAGSLAAGQDPSVTPAAGSAPASSADAPPPLSTNQIQSLVAPVALFPDPLLTQCLVAATYPIDVVEAEQWLGQNANLTGDALSDAAMKQPWDPSVQSLTAFPTVLKQLASNMAWTANLGNAFLDQKDDVMDAVQTLRQQAQQAGKLQSNDQQTVSTQTVDAKPYVVIQPASTQIVYVPTYSPVAIWGPPPFPYPPIWYPPPIYGGGFAIGFAAGVHFGAWFGGGWGWHMGWGGGWGGHTTIIVNNNNTYIHNTNIHNNTYKTGNGNWQHNSNQRGGVPYSRPKSAETRPGAGGAGERQGSDAGRTQGLGATHDGQQTQNRTGDRTAQQRDAQPRDGQQRGGQNADRNAGRIGNRNVGGSARPNNFNGPRTGDRTHQASARGHQSMPNRGGGNRGGGGGEKKH